MINAGYVQRDSRVFMYGQNKKIKKRGAGGGSGRKVKKCPFREGSGGVG